MNFSNLFTNSLNQTGLKRTCNRQTVSPEGGRPSAGAGGPCSKGDECGITGTCISRWSHHQCVCGENEIVAPDCGPSFQPFTLTENQEIHFRPTSKYYRSVQLFALSSSLGIPMNRWRRAIKRNDGSNADGWPGNSENVGALSLTFRTFGYKSSLLTIRNGGGQQYAFTKLEIIDGILVYHSYQGFGKPEINMTTEVVVADGTWHTINLKFDSTDQVLRFHLDGATVGYEVEYSAAHNFLDSNVEDFIIGDANHEGQGM